jgi:hypothetical protein
MYPMFFSILSKLSLTSFLAGISGYPEGILEKKTSLMNA